MTTIFVGRRRRGRAIRAAAALVVAIVVMDLGRDALSRVRSLAVGWAARPFAARFAAGAPASALSAEAAARRDRARHGLYGADAASGTTAAPVLSFDSLRHSIVVPLPDGGASEVGLGTSVTDGESLLGFVDRVDFGLARCRLLGDRGLTVAAEVKGPSAPVRFALVAGGPRGLRIRYATDLDGVPAGAPVVTAPIPDSAFAGLPIGRSVASNGGPVADAVALAVDAALVARVSIAGAAAPQAADPLVAYDRAPAVVVVAEDASPFRRSFLVVADEPLQPGALVEVEGAVVGRVASTSPGSIARVVRPDDPAFVIEVFVVPTGGGKPVARVRLRGVAAPGSARVEAVAGAADAAASGAVLVTAPDNGLAPPGLLVGTIAPLDRIGAGDRIAVGFDGEGLAVRGATVSAWRLRSPLGADEGGSP